jgi:integrase
MEKRKPEHRTVTSHLHPVLAEHLLAWQQQTPHPKSTDFAFSSIRARGRKPLYASTFVADYLRPAAKKAGVQIADGQRFGLHNLLHSLSNWLLSAVGMSTTVN